MAGKTTHGFTKDAQKQKFVRNRDIKMKDKELRHEDKIQRLMCEGVCNRCREKVQWKFRYDKYKPLKAPATCQDCRNKTVTKAYRTLCDQCAKQRNICASCCADMGEANGPSTAMKVGGGETTTLTSSNSNAIVSSVDSTGVFNFSSSMNIASTASSTFSGGAAISISSGTTSTSTGPVRADAGGDWDEKKFRSIVASKYSKERAIGTEDDVAPSTIVAASMDTSEA